MPERLLTIYRSTQIPPVQTVISTTDSDGFDAPAGTLDQICRVDFFDQTGLRAVVPCDPVKSTVQVGDKGVFIELSLTLIYRLGTPKPVSGFTPGMDARLQFDNAQLVFEGGMRLNGSVLRRDDGVTVITDYSEAFTRLAVENAIANGVDSSPLTFLPDTWPTFPFGNSLFYQIRSIFILGQSIDMPILTLERDIPALHNNLLRRLPPPFNIPIALSDSGADFSKISLRATQIPDVHWVSTTTGACENWIVDVSRFQAGTIADFWQRSIIDLYLGYLEAGGNIGQVSMLPTLTDSQDDIDWRLRLPVPAGSGPISLQFLGDLALQTPPTDTVTMSCSAFQTHAGKGLSFTASLNNDSSQPESEPWIRFSLSNVQFTGGDDGVKVRLGSLDLTFKVPNATTIWMKCGITFFQLNSDFWVPQVTVTGSTMPLAAILPGGQDDPDDPQLQQALSAFEAAGQDPTDPKTFASTLYPLYAREPALLIPVPPTGGGNGTPPILTAALKESAVRGQGQLFNLSVFNSGGGSGDPTDVLVIDRNPFLVALARLPNLASTASASTGEIAEWSNTIPGGPAWQISAGAGSFQLFLPPQGVGEAMVTGLRLPGEPNDNQRANFRLTPPAQAVLESSDQSQEFGEPGWNLRRWLGYPGERAPGSIVDSAKVESLFGLVCNIVASGLQISEMFSRLGGGAGPLVDAETGSIVLTQDEGYTELQVAHFNNLNQSWGALYNQLLSRLSILDLWNQQDVFDLQLTDGVSYQLRNTETLPPGGTLQFAGGLPYALQSENLLGAVQSNPNSTAAQLMGPRLSALGGYGRQRAAFANGNIIVESEVSMGLLDSLSITVIGRIGNLWHHAKHVTVYERSVRPSRQFYLEQPLLQGRPILRKVSEYIEIVQKTRSYPESGSAIGCGFVQSAEFKSIRINVDSSWGTNVGLPTAANKTAASTIPLWRRNAVPADVYPRPHVLLQLATDPATGSAATMAEILDPEKLCFYADPNQGTSNTDNWPAVDSVDFCVNLPYRSLQPDPLAGLTPSDFTAEPGFGHFTYSVAADAGQVNIVSQRTSNAISSALRSVSFMRAQNNAALPVEPQQSAGRITDFVNDTLDELTIAAQTAKGDITAIQAAVTNRLNANDIQASLVKPLSAACGVIAAQNNSAALCTALANIAGSAMQNAATQLSAVWTSLFTSAQNQLIAAANAAQPVSIQQALLNEVDTVYASLQNALGPLLSDLSVAASLVTQLASVGTEISTDLGNLENTITDISLAVAGFRQSCQVTLQRCQSDLDGILGDIQQLTAAASFLLGSRAAGVPEVNDATTAALAFSATLGGDFAVVLNDILDQTMNAATINGDIDNIKKLLPPQDLQTALNALAAKLTGISADANSIPAKLAALRDDLRTAIKSVTTTTTADYINKMATVFVNDTLGDFNTVVAQAIAAIQAQIKAVCGTLLADFSGLTNKIKDFLSTAAITDALADCTSAADCVAALDDLRATYATSLDSLVQQCRDLVTTPVSPTSTAISLLRAFGAPPAVPGLDFGDTSAIAYFYNQVSQTGNTIVNTLVSAVPVSAGLQSFVTQASSAIQQGADQLAQLGISQLPTSAILDRLVPDTSQLEQMLLSDLFPNIAGLNLASLFSGIKVPSLASDNIQISHNIDPQTLRASLDIAFNFPIATSATELFSIGPATITIDTCFFQADVHVAGGPGQLASQTSSGSISGNWHVLIGGSEIITFVDTSLSFDQSGKLHFDIQPPRVRLAAVLQFLAQFVEDIGLGGGFTLNVLPAGIQCLLELPFPDMSAGAFGISNLSLGCVFQLSINPFAITVGANLGLQQAPFTLTIFILGGAGWFQSNIAYIPSTGQLTADVSVAILASASLSISLGPISGGVYIYFGITAEYHSAGGLDLGILLMIQGRVSLLGIVDADITLLLEAEYTSGGGMTGRGEVDISIKICWCFTFEVHQSVEYTFGSASGGNSNSSSNQPSLLGAKFLPRSTQIAQTTAIAAASVPDPTPYAQTATDRINFLT